MRKGASTSITKGERTPPKKALNYNHDDDQRYDGRTMLTVHKDKNEDEDSDGSSGGDSDDGDDDDDDNEEEEAKLSAPRQILCRTKNTRERWCARSEENDSSTSLGSDSLRAIRCGVMKREKKRGRSA